MKRLILNPVSEQKQAEINAAYAIKMREERETARLARGFNTVEIALFAALAQKAIKARK